MALVGCFCWDICAAASFASDTKTGAHAGAQQKQNVSLPTGSWAFIPVQSEASLKQVQSGALTSFEIVNNTSEKLFGYWLNGQGKRQRFFELEAGAKHSQQTYSNHVWVIANARAQTKAIFMVGSAPEIVMINKTGNNFVNQPSQPILSTTAETAKPSTTVKPDASGEATDLSSLPDEDTIPFTKNASGHLVVQAELNGRPLEMLFDTGANGCNAGMNHLKTAGVDTSNLKGRSGVVGGSSGGAVGIKIVPMSLKLGKTTRVVDMWLQENSPSAPLVGQNFLKGLQYEINNQLHVIRLKKSTNVATNSVAEKYDPRDRNAVPFKMNGQNIIVPVEVSGMEVPMIFDTGAFGVVFPLQMWSQIIKHFKSPPKLVGRGMTAGIDGPTPTLVYVVDRIDFGPVSMTDVKVFVSSPGPPIPLLGQNVLGTEKFIIDNSKNIIRFHR